MLALDAVMVFFQRALTRARGPHTDDEEYDFLSDMSKEKKRLKHCLKSSGCTILVPTD